MISAIILSKNNDNTLEICLRSVINSLPKDKEIIVVDAHSTDNTPKILAKYSDKIRVVYDEGKGLGLARNVGVKAATHDIIVFVDSDVFCSNDHFQRFQEYFNEHKDVAAIDTPGIHPVFGTLPQRLEAKLYRIFDQSSYSCLRGWCLAFRRSAFDAVGGFSAATIGSDDVEFSYKLRERGFKLGTVATKSVHIPRSTISTLVKEMKLWGKNQAKYNWSHRHVLEYDWRKRKLMRFFHSAWLVNLISRFAAPLIAVRYAIKARTLSLYPYYIVRQYAYAFGYMQGLLEVNKNG